MARKKSAESIDAEIARVKIAMSKLQDKYEKLGEQLKNSRSRNVSERQMKSWRRSSKAAKASMRS